MIIKSACSLFSAIGSFAETSDGAGIWESFRYDNINHVLDWGMEVGIGEIELSEVIFPEG